MRRSLVRVSALLAITLVVSCRDKSPTGTLPIDGYAPPGACTTINTLVSLTHTVFDPNSANVTSVLGQLETIQSQLKAGNNSGAQDQARSIVTFVQKKVGAGAISPTQPQIQTLISSVLCYVGLSPDTYLVQPTDAPRVLLTADKKAGVSLQGNSVAEPTLITITTLPTDVSPLNTKLDVYPGYVLVTQSAVLTKPVVVGVCPAASVPASVLPRLRLGHQKSSGFEITPPADASFLDCSAATSQSTLPGWLRALASLVTPKPLYAAKFSGGVGGIATEFSPFGPVDTDLRFSGGVGGTATEFQTPGTRVTGAATSVCAAVTAPVNGAIDPECRPGVTLKTAKGTVLQNVPVKWAIGLGGGNIAPEASITRTCGAFFSTAATATDVNGHAGVCWLLGASPGGNSTIATPSVGGDAPDGVTFTPANITFDAFTSQITPTAGATGGTFSYDAQPHPGTGTCSNGLVPALSYSGVSTPINAGTYTLTVTCGAGNALYKAVTQTATIQITPVTAQVTISCPASVAFTGTALTPCTALATGSGLSQSLVPTYSSNVVGTATATAGYSGDVNHLPATAVSRTFKILYVQGGVFSSLPDDRNATTAVFLQGRTVDVIGELFTASGTGVVGATGNLIIQDRGTDGNATPVTVFSATNAFTAGTGGSYSYSLATAGFAAGHFYFVTATWNDGSTMGGWLYLR